MALTEIPQQDGQLETHAMDLTLAQPWNQVISALACENQLEHPLVVPPPSPPAPSSDRAPGYLSVGLRGAEAGWMEQTHETLHIHHVS